MRIGIYINNQNIADVDCSGLRSGNPGIGGTEYCILLLAQVYKESFPHAEVVLFASCDSKLPKVDRVEIVEHIDVLCEAARKSRVDMLIISAVHESQPLSQGFFKELEEKRIKTILWGHNFYLSDFCDRVSKCSAIKANVFVGQQQYDRYIDHRIIKKSTYIYNMYPLNQVGKRERIENHSVTYIGSLVSTKGFHVLAGAWKDILKRMPDATLNVIGSGKLYGCNSKLGHYHIADEEYEAVFMPYLVDDKGDILKSVHFLGVLGTEKNDVIQQTCVGVVNPTGRTETFGISALDFESQGVPVVTIAKGGFLDTVIDDETGILIGKTEELTDAVVSLLKDREKNKQYGENGIKLAEQFSPDRILDRWNELFMTVIEDKSLPYIAPDTFMKINLKWLRKWNRSIHSPISVIKVETSVRKMLRRLGK